MTKQVPFESSHRYQSIGTFCGRNRIQALQSAWILVHVDCSRVLATFQKRSKPNVSNLVDSLYWAITFFTKILRNPFPKHLKAKRFLYKMVLTQVSGDHPQESSNHATLSVSTILLYPCYKKKQTKIDIAVSVFFLLSYF